VPRAAARGTTHAHTDADGGGRCGGPHQRAGSGADDYLTSHLSFASCSPRLRALLRRSGELRPARISIADLVLDTGAQSVSRAVEIFR